MAGRLRWTDAAVPGMGDHAKVNPSLRPAGWSRRRARGGARPPDRPRRHSPWLLLIGVIQVFIGAAVASHHPMTIWGYPLLLAGPTVLLLWHGRRPAVAVVGVGAVTLVFLALGYPIGPVVPSTVIAVVNAVVRGARVAAWVSLGGLWLGWLGLGWLGWREFGPWLGELRGLGLAVLLAGLAELIDNRRQRAIVYRRLWEEERRRREEEEQRRAGEERLRIARELHDVLAHSLSLITVRASVALELMDSDPAEVREALLAIKQASKSGLAEVRTVLDGLRGAADSAPRAPAPDLSRLDELVAQAATAGLRVALDRSGEPGDVPAAVGLAGYRIVQEALTNVLRHSQSRTAVVHVHRSKWGLLIGVADEGPARATPDGSGSGLIGIHERAAALGGVAQAGPAPAGGFHVEAALPIVATTAAAHPARPGTTVEPPGSRRTAPGTAADATGTAADAAWRGTTVFGPTGPGTTVADHAPREAPGPDAMGLGAADNTGAVREGDA